MSLSDDGRPVGRLSDNFFGDHHLNLKSNNNLSTTNYRKESKLQQKLLFRGSNHSNYCEIGRNRIVTIIFS